VQQVGDLIAEIARRGVAILLVEQKLSIAMRISHRSMSWAMAASCSRARPPR
jgi:ABC-type branched-subunit amino acid transport system ATPase component